MERFKHWVSNPYLYLIPLLWIAGAGLGWQGTLSTRREYYHRLGSYYAGRAEGFRGSPQGAAHYQALSRKYREAAARPWTLAPPRQPER